MARYTLPRSLPKFRALRRSQDPGGFIEGDPISAYAAQVEKELAEEDQETVAGKFQKHASGTVPAGTLIGLEYTAVFADGTKMVMGTQPINNVVLQPGAELRIEGMTFRIT